MNHETEELIVENGFDNLFIDAEHECITVFIKQTCRVDMASRGAPGIPSAWRLHR
jgi:2-keto-3-deoxy-L-rhamnonate aldolase RhmA